MSSATSTNAVSHSPYDERLSYRGLSVRSGSVTATLIGYARCSTEKQDVEAQRQVLLGLGVVEERIYLDRALNRQANRRRPPAEPWLRSRHPTSILKSPPVPVRT